MPKQSVSQSLVKLGLTELEAEVYTYLVGNSPVTGYAAAKATGKPTANVYKALESLYEKGAILEEGGPARLYRAVPAAEFLEALERTFRHVKAQAASELARVTPAPDDERVYHLRSRRQVFERFRHLLSRTETVALLDLFPVAVDALRADIEAAAARGVAIAIKVYKPCKLRGAEVVVDPDGERSLRRWPGQWANGIFDAKELMLALLTKDGEDVHQAISSSSAYLSLIYHSGMAFELMYTSQLGRREGLSESGRPGRLSQSSRLSGSGRSKRPSRGSKRRVRRSRLDEILDAHTLRQAPGYRMLMERLGEKPPSRGRTKRLGTPA